MTESLSAEPTYFSEDEIMRYNSLKYAGSLYSIWQPVASVPLTQDGFPIYDIHSNAIMWLCLIWSPCSNIVPKFPYSPDVYFLVEFTNALTPMTDDTFTFCNFTMRFWVHVHGLPFDTLRVGIPVLLMTLAVLAAICLLYFICMRNDEAVFRRLSQPAEHIAQELTTTVKKKLDI